MKIKAVPEGYSTVTPYIVAKDAMTTFEFLKRAFDAHQVSVHLRPNFLSRPINLTETAAAPLKITTTINGGLLHKKKLSQRLKLISAWPNNLKNKII